MKIVFGIIVFEGDYVLKECLEQVYPFAYQILVAEGPVSYWQRQGRTTSLDKTNEILNNFPDPENKITIIHGQYSEKDEQCRTYMQYIRDDADYIWNLDSDEVFKTEDLKKIIEFLKKEKPTSVGIRSCSFYGGFERYLTGFELNKDNFLRIFKYVKGSVWLTHRPPTMLYPVDILKKHIDSEILYSELNVQMYHYSYVFPRQVASKVGYYKSDISKQDCIDNYFYRVYLPWVLGDDNGKKLIEDKYQGVHEIKPNLRGACYTEGFSGTHPESILRNMDKLTANFQEELETYKTWYNTDVLPEDMVRGAMGIKWPRLEYADHFKILDYLIKSIKIKNLADIGCGAGELGRVYSTIDYTGFDLPHIIEKVSKIVNPSLKYCDFDANKSDFMVFRQFDLLVCNSFISELLNPIEILDKILSNTKKYLIIHRQCFSHVGKFRNYITYGNLIAWRSYICNDEFNSLLKNYDCEIVKELLSSDNRSLLIQRI